MNAIELYIPWKIDMDTILDSLGSVLYCTSNIFKHFQQNHLTNSKSSRPFSHSVWRVLGGQSGRIPPFFKGWIKWSSVTKPFKKETFSEKKHLISREFPHPDRGEAFPDRSWRSVMLQYFKLHHRSLLLNWDLTSLQYGILLNNQFNVVYQCLPYIYIYICTDIQIYIYIYKDIA